MDYYLFKKGNKLLLQATMWVLTLNNPDANGHIYNFRYTKYPEWENPWRQIFGRSGVGIGRDLFLG